MGRIFNKIARKVVSLFQGGDSVAQETHGGISHGEIAIDGFAEIIRETGAEGCVLLKNDRETLPLKSDDVVSLFGRVARDGFYVGYGSGGDVVAPYAVNILTGLKNAGVKMNEELEKVYDIWRKVPKNEADEGFWGHWPFGFKEMPVSDELAKNAAKESNIALVVIGRAAGEDRENKLTKGSYYLTDTEKDMLEKATKYFKRVAVVLNCGGIFDMSWVEEYGDKIGAIIYVWQGGMETGNAVADVLTGKVCPSGSLTDTIAKKYEDYPSSAHFGNKEGNDYVEDIFVGYRYFETFKKDRVLYPFGYGLSYGKFTTELMSFEEEGEKVKFAFKVNNVGDVAGKETVQLYCEAPQGTLGKAKRILVGFKKTDVIPVGGSEEGEIVVDRYAFSSYDDSGKTGHVHSYVLEKGEYKFFFGRDCRTENVAGSVNIPETLVLREHSEVMSVQKPFGRMVAKEANGGLEIGYETTPKKTRDLKERINGNLPTGKEGTDKGYKLTDVKDGKVTLDEFVSQLSQEELENITRGEGKMNSPLGTVGNAGAIGGVSESLRAKGVPPIITTDGPSGIRLKKICALLPCGTLIASTWNEKLAEKLAGKLAEEMIYQGSDVILAPGMNIHRNPLCGRNFEYFSEDPLISGKIAAAFVRGVQNKGVSACPKHFACNNQEVNRTHNDSRVSERALREIYLKGFEIAVKEASPDCIMTSYNKVNGVWSHYNYDLCTTVLRGEWGFDGMVMTDWWMRYAPSQEFPEMSGNAYRVRAQVDVLMPGGKNPVSGGKNDGTLLATYGKADGITLGEMQRSAKNVLKLALKSKAYTRFNEKKD